MGACGGGRQDSGVPKPGTDNGAVVGYTPTGVGDANAKDLFWSALDSATNSVVAIMAGARSGRRPDASCDAKVLGALERDS